MRDLSRLVEAPLRTPERQERQKRQERQRGSAPGPERQLSGGIPRTPLERHAGEIIPPRAPLVPPCGFAASAAAGLRESGTLSFLKGKRWTSVSGGMRAVFGDVSAGTGRASEKLEAVFLFLRNGTGDDTEPAEGSATAVRFGQVAPWRVLSAGVRGCAHPRWPTSVSAAPKQRCQRKGCSRGGVTQRPGVALWRVRA